MSKIVFFIMLLLNFSVYAIKDLSSLKTLKFDVKETQFSHNTAKTQQKLIKYSIDLEFPDRIRKEISYPDINKGELYIYNGTKKTIYLPIFEEYKDSEVDVDENEIIRILNSLKDIEKDKTKRKKYLDKTLDGLFFKNSNINVKFSKYTEVDDYVLPSEIEIFQDNIKLAKIEIYNIMTNPTLKKEMFEIKKEEK